MIFEIISFGARPRSTRLILIIPLFGYRRDLTTGCLKTILDGTTIKTVYGSCSWINIIPVFAFYLHFYESIPVYRT
jgi:hypothetical protein